MQWAGERKSHSTFSMRVLGWSKINRIDFLLAQPIVIRDHPKSLKSSQ